jgi:hypothetical protein
MFSGFRSRWITCDWCARDPDRLLHGKRPARDEGTQGFPFHELHGDEYHSFGLADFIDRRDVRVGDRSGGARLAQEAQAPFLVADQIGWQDFERHRAAELLVLGPVNHTHTPFAHLGEDPKVGEGAPDQGLLVIMVPCGRERVEPDVR